MEKTDLPNKLATRLKRLYKLQIHCPLLIKSFLHLTTFLLEAISLLSNLFTFVTESQISCIKLWMEDLDLQQGWQLRSKWRRSRGRCAKDRWQWPKWQWRRGKRKVRMVEDVKWLSRGRRGHRGHNLARSKARARLRDYNGNAVRRNLRLWYRSRSIIRIFAFQALIPWWGDMDRWFGELLRCGNLATSFTFCWLLLLLLTFLKAFLWDDRWGLLSFGDRLCIEPLAAFLLVSTLLAATILGSSFLHNTIWLANAFVALAKRWGLIWVKGIKRKMYPWDLDYPYCRWCLFRGTTLIHLFVIVIVRCLWGKCQDVGQQFRF